MAVHIGKGRICAMTDSKGEGGTKLDGCHGELVLDVDGGTVFSVSQYRGDPLLSYLCIEGQRVELYHRAVVPDSPLPERLEVPSFTPPTHLDPTIYPSEEGEFLVALRLQGATLRHHMALTNQSWHEQVSHTPQSVPILCSALQCSDRAVQCSDRAAQCSAVQ
ncbi:UNVERIFIED_CONTAM: hypothetical protein FKN15_065991 [Acipenser sinensis]